MWILLWVMSPAMLCAAFDNAVTHSWFRGVLNRHIRIKVYYLGWRMPFVLHWHSIAKCVTPFQWVGQWFLSFLS
jgi:hypothetical protein